jgi:Glycosyl transferase family 2
MRDRDLPAEGKARAPSLSVIMPMYNAARFVDAAVRSILGQSHADFEFLIVDDGSTDQSAEIVSSLAAQDSRIQLFQQANQGIVASLNRMIDIARGPIIARMDADDISLPDRFARQIAYLNAHPDIGALGTQFIEVDEQGAVRDATFRHPTGSGAVMAALFDGMPVANPTVMFRADQLRAAGGYRQAFRHCEDYDLFLRLSRISQIDNLPDVLFHYRRSQGQMSVAAHNLQTRQAIKARFAHQEVLAGRGDPFEGLASLPTPDRLDQHLGRRGVGEAILAEIALRLQHSPAALRGAEFAMICSHARSGKPFAGGLRTVARCVRLGMPGRAMWLALALFRGRMRLMFRRMESNHEETVKPA